MKADRATVDTVVAASGERKTLSVLSKRLGGLRRGNTRLVAADGTTMIVPNSLFQVLKEAVKQLNLGNGVSILPTHAELTTQQAADLLGVSRPHLVGLLEAGDIPFFKVGTHRRVKLHELLRFKSGRESQTREALRELSADAQDLGIYGE